MFIGNDDQWRGDHRQHNDYDQQVGRIVADHAVLSGVGEQQEGELTALCQHESKHQIVGQANAKYTAQYQQDDQLDHDQQEHQQQLPSYLRLLRYGLSRLLHSYEMLQL